uniref:Uncharacterized protein n=1 Tax=Chinese broad-headed pond turtle astro-like virus TaxID=2116326 RepID=A0A2P1GNB1_9VIRU|nr:hypothetical protein [Chinese broad-headed pond turtle astro-like virus]
MSLWLIDKEGDWHPWDGLTKPPSGSKPFDSRLRSGPGSRASGGSGRLSVGANSNKSGRNRRRKPKPIGGEFSDHVPCDPQDKNSTGPANDKHPHRHSDEQVVNTRPNDWTFPSRSRVSGAKHRSVGGGITQHDYCVTWYTCERPKSQPSTKRKVGFGGQSQEFPFPHPMDQGSDTTTI